MFAVGKKMIVYIVCNFIPIMYATYLAVQFFQLLIPIMGHIGMEIDSEMVMWILCAFFAFLIFSYLVSIKESSAFGICGGNGFEQCTRVF